MCWGEEFFLQLPPTLDLDAVTSVALLLLGLALVFRVDPRPYFRWRSEEPHEAQPVASPKRLPLGIVWRGKRGRMVRGTLTGLGMEVAESADDLSVEDSRITAPSAAPSAALDHEYPSGGGVVLLDLRDGDTVPPRFTVHGYAGQSVSRDDILVQRQQSDGSWETVLVPTIELGAPSATFSVVAELPVGDHLIRVGSHAKHDGDPFRGAELHVTVVAGSHRSSHRTR